MIAVRYEALDATSAALDERTKRVPSAMTPTARMVIDTRTSIRVKPSRGDLLIAAPSSGLVARPGVGPSVPDPLQRADVAQCPGEGAGIVLVALGTIHR